MPESKLNLWDTRVAEQLSDPLDLRVYTSKLLGGDANLVMHGGGNTSVKGELANLFGEKEPVIFIKGSGWDLATIEKAGFPAVRLRPLLALRQLKSLGDVEMMNYLRTQLLDSAAPDPSVETLLHAFLPHRYIDHTHADAILTLTNQPNAEKVLHEIFGKRVAIVPYVMPGFLLAKKCAEVFEQDTSVEGMILLKHGIFSFGETAKEAYDRMIRLVSVAADYIENTANMPQSTATTKAPSDVTSFWMQSVRKEFAKRGLPGVVHLNQSERALTFVNHPKLREISQRGPLTPDHVIRTKSLPLCLSHEVVTEKLPSAFVSALEDYSAAYRRYFESNCAAKKMNCTMLDTLPRVLLLPSVGILTFGKTEKDAAIATDIYSHTAAAILNAENMAGYIALGESDLFEMEYWILEQNKLKLGSSKKPLSGKVAVVTGGAGGIGLGITKELMEQGASVFALDISENAGNIVAKTLPKGKAGNRFHFIKCDVANRANVKAAIEQVVRTVGGMDMVVVNAGVFPASQLIEDIATDQWERSLNINLGGAFHTIAEVLPWMKRQEQGGDIILIASKNVPAPGQKWGTYSVSKAGQAQLGRIAALEAASHGIRVNMLHPHLVEDTSLWTEEVVAARAKAYSMTPDEYKKNNLLKVSLSSADVAKAVFALVAGYFSKTTGAQIPVDGGSDRTL